MEDLNEILSKKIIYLLSEVLNLIENEVEKNPFLDLERSMKIVELRNYKQYSYVKKMVGNVIRMMYEQRFFNKVIILKKLDEVYILVTESQT
jgi:hypothetical protein